MIAHDIITAGMMFFACTLLHRELRDYSFGQIAFAVHVICYHTAALPCKRVVKHNYISACNILDTCLACIKSKQTRMIKKFKIQKVSRD